MKNLILLLCALLPGSLWGQSKIFPSAPNKVIGVIVAGETSRWIAISERFAPATTTILDPDDKGRGKVCMVEGEPGKYMVWRLPPDDGQPEICFLLLTTLPVTPPVFPPGPVEPPVNPPVPVPPLPLAGMRVLILEETAPAMNLKTPAERERYILQQAAMNSATVRAYLDAKCLKGPDGRTPEWRKFDQHALPTNLPQVWQDLRAKAAPSSIPWVVVGDSSGVVSQGPYPANESEALAFFKKYGG